MNSTERKKLRQQADADYQKALEMARSKYEKAIASIEHVWEMYHPQKLDNALMAQDGIKPSSDSDYGSLSVLVRKALKDVNPDLFTRIDVFSAMRIISPEEAVKYKKSSIAGCLSRLCKQSVIELIKEGVGRIPAQYKIKNTEKG